MIYVDRTKYDRTKSVAFLKYRSLPVGRTRVTARQLEADAVATKFGASKGGVVPESVAGKHGAASPTVNEPDVPDGARRPAGTGCFSPGKQPDVRDGVSSVAEYVGAINGNWQRGVDALMNIASLCAKADARLTTAQKSELIHALPFGNTAFSKFVQIGSDIRLYAPQIQRVLPPHYTTTYAVTLLTDKELKHAIAEQVIHPDLTRAQLQKWRNLHRKDAGVAPSHKDAASDSAVVGLPIGSTQDAVNKEELTSAPDNAPPEAVAPGAGPLAPPPSDDIPPFLDRRPLAPEDQEAYDAVKAIWNSHVLPLWKSASEIVRERLIAEVVRANPSGYVPGRTRPEVVVGRKSLGPRKVRGSLD
jgi:hypothetical protein